MSCSKEWFEYHLTPNGWVAGSERVDFAGVHSKEIPSDRVLTLCFHEEMSSPFSRMETWYNVSWVHPDTSLVNTLKAKYGDKPNDYSEKDYPLRP